MNDLFAIKRIERAFQEAARLLAAGDPDIKAGRFSPTPKAEPAKPARAETAKQRRA